MCLPALMILGIIIGGVCACFLPMIAVNYFAVLALYVMIVGLESIRLSIVNRFPQGLVMFPMVFPAIHFAAGFGELLEMVKPLQRGKE